VLHVDLSTRDSHGRAVVALRGELDLAGAPGVASHLIAAVAACGPSVILERRLLADTRGRAAAGGSLNRAGQGRGAVPGPER
jgi:hypothetical protein